jgi:hypothetical protein
MNMKRLTIELDPALHQRLKLHAVLSDKTITDIIRELLDRELPALPGRQEKAAS